ncbi:hypothetical protein SAMN05421858_2460 [Haladaptatus litoreus]|uniref:Uncharacterized protein n=1 Tax=Haladaptatus litoreus TaxID=553468 RepID=A0A1N7BBJ0_9EURY|nr:hypothetical protein [Haladaptatus litoreus]SIR48707.1 hypothetical protein SAMN05421858_2460 [Haladaptatus litoreus]
MCHSRKAYYPIEDREPTREERESRDERESPSEKRRRVKEEGILIRAKSSLASLFDTPGEDGRREPEPTMKMGTRDD